MARRREGESLHLMGPLLTPWAPDVIVGGSHAGSPAWKSGRAPHAVARQDDGRGSIALDRVLISNRIICRAAGRRVCKGALADMGLCA